MNSKLLKIAMCLMLVGGAFSISYASSMENSSQPSNEISNNKINLNNIINQSGLINIPNNTSNQINLKKKKFSEQLKTISKKVTNQMNQMKFIQAKNYQIKQGKPKLTLQQKYGLTDQQMKDMERLFDANRYVDMPLTELNKCKETFSAFLQQEEVDDDDLISMYENMSEAVSSAQSNTDAAKARIDEFKEYKKAIEDVISTKQANLKKQQHMLKAIQETIEKEAKSLGVLNTIYTKQYEHLWKYIFDDNTDGKSENSVFTDYLSSKNIIKATLDQLRDLYDTALNNKKEALSKKQVKAKKQNLNISNVEMLNLEFNNNTLPHQEQIVEKFEEDNKSQNSENNEEEGGNHIEMNMDNYEEEEVEQEEQVDQEEQVGQEEQVDQEDAK